MADATLTIVDEQVVLEVSGAALLAPLVGDAASAAARAENALRETQGYAAIAGSAGVSQLQASGAGNAIEVNTPPDGFQDGRLYRFMSPVTSTGAVTINGRPLLGSSDAPLSVAGSVFTGGEVIVAWRYAGQVFRLVSAATRRLDDLTNQIAQLDLPGMRSDISLTRDPWILLTQTILRGAFGAIKFANGVRTVTKPLFVIASVGNSHMVGQGAPSGPLMTPGDRLMLVLQGLMPDRTVVHDNYAVPGSWCSQINGQIDGFTRKPDIVLIGDPMNDGTANIFMGYQGFVGPDNTYGGYEAALEAVFVRLDKMGCASINLTGHQPHPTRAKANGRLTVTPEVIMAWPQSSLIAFYLRLVFTKADQRVSAYAGNTPFDLFKAYSNGLFGPGKYLLETNPNSGSIGALHKALEVAADGTWVRVDGTIAADKDDGTSVRQANFDNETEVYPPVSKAIVQRDYSGTGAPVSVSWRHWELAAVNRRVAARNGVVTVDTDAIFGRRVTSDAAYATLFPAPANDDYHSSEWFLMLDAPFRALGRDLVNGTIPAGRIYS